MNEWEFIKLLNKDNISEIELSIGDDCAIIKKGNDYLLLTKDLITEGTHFELKNTPIEYIGEKLADSNISDIIAMGGIPKYALLGIVFPKGKEIQYEKLIDGIKNRLNLYSTSIIGGDTVSGKNLSLSMTIIGEGKRYITRGGAETGDKILISGKLGYSRAGLNEFLTSGKIANKMAFEKYFRPRCRFDLLPIINKTKINSMTDISDGFIQDLSHILVSSGKGGEIYLDNFPVDDYLVKAAENEKIDLYDFILNSGEEYELILTVSEKESLELNKQGFMEVGEITDKKQSVYYYKGKEKKVKNLSYTHSF